MFPRWGYGAAGSASALQAEGQRFDPVYLHHQSNIFGVIAQLGERLHGMQEVIGSIPISSTKFPFISQLTKLSYLTNIVGFSVPL